jgi:hypothetical protein
VPLGLFTVHPDQWAPGSNFAATIGPLVELQGIINLGPLDQHHITVLIESALAGEPDHRQAAHVHGAGLGNPLFARELLPALQEQGNLPSDHGRYYEVGQASIGPVSGRGVLLQRIFHQDRDARELARVMSALRRVQVSDLDLLAELTDVDPVRLQAAFDSLSQASVLVRSATGWYEFAHPLLAEDLGPVERRRVHAPVAERLGAIRRASRADVDYLAEFTVAEAAAAARRSSCDCGDRAGPVRWGWRAHLLVRPR